MPYKIPGVPGTWYEPGTRKANTTIAWRGRLPDGTWTEFFTDSTTDAGAQAFLRTTLERWHRDRPAPAGALVDLGTAALHYKAARCRSDAERDRVDRIVALIGPATPVGDVNHTHLVAAAKAFREQRRQANALALAAREKATEERSLDKLGTTDGVGHRESVFPTDDGAAHTTHVIPSQTLAQQAAPARDLCPAKKKLPQIYPLPSTDTLNRELTTPLRSVLNYAAEAQWRGKIVLRALKAEEGETPSQPPRAAADDDIVRLLEAIDERLATLRPIGKRQLNYQRQRRSLIALRALVYLVHERGYRISEWLRWTWATVDLQAGRARILLSKPSRWVDFTLSPQAVALLSAIEPKPDAGRVFSIAGRRAVYLAVDKVAPAGVTWRPHESRRSVVTAIIRHTGDPTVARDYVGHASIRTTLRYRVVDPGEVRPGVRRGK